MPHLTSNGHPSKREAQNPGFRVYTRAGQFEKKSGQGLRVNSSYIGEHFLLYNMDLYLHPRGAPRPQRFSFSQETAIQKYEN